MSAVKDNPVAQVLELTDGQGADVVIESVGTPATIQQSLDMVKSGGRVIAFGISPQPLPSLDLYRMYLKEVTLIFPRATTRANFYRTVELVASKRVSLKPIVTQQYALEDAAEAFRLAEEEQPKVLRVVIEP